jgi:oxalate decarboxylase
MAVFAYEGHANTVDFKPGDMGYVPCSMGHHIRNTGIDTLRSLEVFNTGHYADVSLNSWLANTPAELAAAHPNIDACVFRQMNESKTPVLPA